MKKKLLFGLLVLTLIALPLCAACEEKPPETLELGAIFVLSGGGALWGQSSLNGLEMAVEEVNEEGVKVNGVTYTFELIIEDDEYLADVGVDRIKKLIEQDEVQFVFGSMASSVNVAIAPILAQNKVLQLASGASKDIVAAGNTYTFSMAIIADFRIPGYLEFIAETYPDVSRVVAIYPDDATGVGNMATVEKTAPELGWELISEGHEPGIVEFGPLCAKVVAEEPGAVVIAGSAPGSARQMAKGLRELGYDGPFVMFGNFPLVSLYEELGDDMGECYEYAGTGEKPYSNDDYTEFYNEYLERYGVEMWADMAALYYSWFKIYVQAIEETQSLDPTVIRDLLETPGREWYHVIGGKCYMITDAIASEMGLGTNHYVNVAFQIASWDFETNKLVNVGWGYPYGWPAGVEFPK